MSVRRIAACCACALVLSSTSAGALAAPDASPVPRIGSGQSEVDTSPATATRAETSLSAELLDVANFAEQYVGSPYRWGGASPAGFDCTGFVMWVYAQFGVALPHTEAGQLASGPRVDAADLQRGDVVVFANTYRRGLSHTGIYVGDGQFVHAADERHGVIVSALWDHYWGPRVVGAARAIS